MEGIQTSQKFLFLVALVLALAAIAYVVCSSVSFSPNPGPFAQALMAGDIDSVMVVGDSISAGYKTPGTVEGPPSEVLFTDVNGFTYLEPDHGNGAWANHLRTYLADHGVDDFKNASINGMTFNDLNWEFDAWVGDGADAIVVMLGTNDAAMYGRSAFTDSCTRALKRLSERCTYLVVIAPPQHGAGNSSGTIEIAEVADVLAAVCEEHGWEFISTYDVLEPDSDDYQADRLHPTAQGQDKLWASISYQLGLK